LNYTKRNISVFARILFLKGKHNVWKGDNMIKGIEILKIIINIGLYIVFNKVYFGS